MSKRRSYLHTIVQVGPFVAAMGAVFGFFIGGMTWKPRMLAHAALISLTCFVVAIGGEKLFEKWFTDDTPWWRRALLYFSASLIGFPIALVIGGFLFLGEHIDITNLPRRVITIALVTGAIGALLGVAFFTFELMKDRLRTSIAALKEQEFAQKELELARELQSRMLPSPQIEGDGYRITARNIAARYVAGDFYDVFRCTDGSVAVVVADVAGKGLAASLIMASVKAVLPIFGSTERVAETLAIVNERLADQLGSREFVALALARFEPISGRIEVGNAGVPNPYIVRADGRIEELSVPGPRLPLGIRRGIAYESIEAVLAHGDSIVLLSDGMPEATMADGNPLGYERFEKILHDARGGEYVDAVVRDVRDAATPAQEDDWTILRLEACSRSASIR